MDKRTRVLNAFNGLSTDRVPVGFWFHFTGDESVGEGCINAHLNFYRQIDPDMIKIMSDTYFKHPIPIQINKASDWKKLQPLKKDDPFIQEQVHRVKSIVDGINRECCTFYNVFAPFSSIRFATSDELVTSHLKEDPEAVMYALQVIAHDNALIAESVIKDGGCDGIYYCLQGGELDRMTGEEYKKYISPSDLYVLNHANKSSENNILHCCGWAGDKNRMENWQSYPAKVINWAVHVEDMSLSQGKKFFGGKTVLGGFDNRPTGALYKGTKEEVIKEAFDILEDVGTKGVILGADCTLPADIQKERIRWVIDALSNK